MCPMAVKFSILKVIILMKAAAAKMSKMFPMGLLGISCIEVAWFQACGLQLCV
jgi:hypothetical protein